MTSNRIRGGFAVSVGSKVIGPHNILISLFVVGNSFALALTLTSCGSWYQLPTCDNSAAIETLKKAFDGAQFARTLNLSAVDVGSVSESSYDDASGTRKCVAVLTMNNTNKVTVDYQLEKRAAGKFMLTFQIQQ